jgi:hypothetical protein
MRCIQQIVAYHRLKMLESEGRVKGSTGVSKKGPSKTQGKASKAKQTLPTPVHAVGDTYSNPVNCKLSFDFCLQEKEALPFIHLMPVGKSVACFVVTSYEDEAEDHLKVLSAVDLAKTVMPFLTTFMAFEKRVKTMNQGQPLPIELMEFFEEQTCRGVGIMSLSEMVDTTDFLARALKLDQPVAEQVRYNSIRNSN